MLFEVILEFLVGSVYKITTSSLFSLFSPFPVKLVADIEAFGIIFVLFNSYQKPVSVLTSVKEFLSVIENGYSTNSIFAVESSLSGIIIVLLAATVRCNNEPVVPPLIVNKFEDASAQLNI